MSKTKNMFEASAIVSQAMSNMECAIKAMPKSEEFLAGQLHAILVAMDRVRADTKAKASYLKDKKSLGVK